MRWVPSPSAGGVRRGSGRRGSVRRWSRRRRRRANGSDPPARTPSGAAPAACSRVWIVRSRTSSSSGGRRYWSRKATSASTAPRNPASDLRSGASAPAKAASLSSVAAAISIALAPGFGPPRLLLRPLRFFGAGGPVAPPRRPPAEPHREAAQVPGGVGVADSRPERLRLQQVGAAWRRRGQLRVIEEGTAQEPDPGGEPARIPGELQRVGHRSDPGLARQPRLLPGRERNPERRQHRVGGFEVVGRSLGREGRSGDDRGSPRRPPPGSGPAAGRRGAFPRRGPWPGRRAPSRIPGRAPKRGRRLRRPGRRSPGRSAARREVSGAMAAAKEDRTGSAADGGPGIRMTGRETTGLTTRGRRPRPTPGAPVPPGGRGRAIPRRGPRRAPPAAAARRAARPRRGGGPPRRAPAGASRGTGGGEFLRVGEEHPPQRVAVGARGRFDPLAVAGVGAPEPAGEPRQPRRALVGPPRLRRSVSRRGGETPRKRGSETAMRRSPDCSSRNARKGSASWAGSPGGASSSTAPASSASSISISRTSGGARRKGGSSSPARSRKSASATPTSGNAPPPAAGSRSRSIRSSTHCAPESGTTIRSGGASGSEAGAAGVSAGVSAGRANASRATHSRSARHSGNRRASIQPDGPAPAAASLMTPAMIRRRNAVSRHPPQNAAPATPAEAGAGGRAEVGPARRAGRAGRTAGRTAGRPGNCREAVFRARGSAPRQAPGAGGQGRRRGTDTRYAIIHITLSFTRRPANRAAPGRNPRATPAAASAKKGSAPSGPGLTVRLDGTAVDISRRGSDRSSARAPATGGSGIRVRLDGGPVGIRRHLGGSVYFLLDISPSMQGDGLAQAKRGLQDLVGQVISDGFGSG